MAGCCWCFSNAGQLRVSGGEKERKRERERERERERWTAVQMQTVRGAWDKEWHRERKRVEEEEGWWNIPRKNAPPLPPPPLPLSLICLPSQLSSTQQTDTAVWGTAKLLWHLFLSPHRWVCSPSFTSVWSPAHTRQQPSPAHRLLARCLGCAQRHWLLWKW